jgi:hypothetical protein
MRRQSLTQLSEVGLLNRQAWLLAHKVCSFPHCFRIPVKSQKATTWTELRQHRPAVAAAAKSRVYVEAVCLYGQMPYHLIHQHRNMLIHPCAHMRLRQPFVVLATPTPVGTHV